MPLLPGGSLCDQHCFPLRYPSIFPIGLFSMELKYSDECAVNQRNQNVCLLNTVIAVYRLFSLGMEPRLLLVDPVPEMNRR